MLEVLDGITMLHVVKGKRVVSTPLADSRPPDETLRALLLGPSGNLRAPTLKTGTSLIVGFDPAIYQQVLADTPEPATAS